MGPEGAAGFQGSTGLPGEKGDQGMPGPAGPLGLTGPQGLPGSQGLPGLRGSPGISGDVGPTGNPGAVGLPGKIGEPGPRGHKGDRGRRGPKGHKGELGLNGLKGDMGEKGERGPRGEQGIEGIKGELGPMGYTGAKGNEGPQGPPGELGPPGPKGSDGVAGAKGETGPMGNIGAPGPPAEAPLLPPELLFRINNDYMRRDESRKRRDIEDDFDDNDIDQLMAAAVTNDTSTTSTKKPAPKKSKKQRRKEKDELEPKFLDMYNSIYSMRKEMDRIRKPLGTSDNPVRTCRDLHYGHPQFEDGWYWIDPNLGMPDDAIRVYCNMTANGETCIEPDTHSAQIPNIPWRKENGINSTDWYSNLRGGLRITYESIGIVQMTFLRLLAQDGYQTFTYTCINSAAWYNSKLDNYDSAIKLLGENEMEIGYNISGNVRPNVLKDGCKSGQSKGETIFEIRTKKLDYLPIIDFYPVDYGLPNQAFGFHAGPLCFK